MAVKFTYRSSVLAALAVGVAALALPTTASAQDHGGWQGDAAQAPATAPQAPAPARTDVPAAQPRFQRHVMPPQAQAPVAQSPHVQRQGQWQGRGNAGNPAVAAPSRDSANHGENWRSTQNQGQWNRGDAGRAGQWNGGDAGRPGQSNRGDAGRSGQWNRGDAGHSGQWNRGDAGRSGQWNNSGRWNNGWRNDNRYDWRGWRSEHRDTFHAGRYSAPFNDYFYHRLGVGFFLEPMFYGYDYLIDNPWEYRLPPAYGPYHWVRYYNDVLLVDTETGEVVDTIYDFFW